MKAEPAPLSRKRELALSLEKVISSTLPSSLSKLARLEEEDAWSTEAWITAVSKALDISIKGELRELYPQTLTKLRDICFERNIDCNQQSLRGSMTDLCLGVLTQGDIKAEYTALLLKQAREAGIEV